MVIIAIAGAAVAMTVRGARIFVVLLIVDVVILLEAPSFFLHYASLTTPMLALVFGVALGRVIGLVRVRGARFAFAGVVAALLVVANSPHVLRGSGVAVPTATLAARAAHVRGCVMAEDPTMLVVSNVLTRNLDEGCPLWPDVTGYTYGPDRKILANGEGIPRPQNVGWQRTVMRYLTSGAAAILSRTATGLDADSHRMITHDGTTLYKQPGLLFVRTPDRES
jgi:hypothetical protein